MLSAADQHLRAIALTLLIHLQHSDRDSHDRRPEQEVAQDLKRVGAGETGDGETHEVSVADSVSGLDPEQLGDSIVVRKLERVRGPGNQGQALLGEELFQVAGESNMIRENADSTGYQCR